MPNLKIQQAPVEISIDPAKIVWSVYQERRLKAGIDPASENGVQGSLPGDSYELVTVVDAIADATDPNSPRVSHVPLDSLGLSTEAKAAILEHGVTLVMAALSK